MAQFTDERKAAEARREVDMRRRIYKRRVGNGAMSESEARYQIAVMEEIAADYEAKAAVRTAAPAAGPAEKPSAARSSG